MVSTTISPTRSKEMVILSYSYAFKSILNGELVIMGAYYNSL